jgi:hypothetical protein
MNMPAPVLAFAALSVLVGPAALGQSAPEWNRRAEALAVYPDPGDPSGPARIFVVWSIGSSNLSAPVDMTTELVFALDGTVIDSFTIPASAGPNFNECLDGNDCGAAECGDGDYGGNGVTFHCITEDIIQGITDCACKETSPPEWPDFPLAIPGGVSCSLVPGGGGVTETRRDDDTILVDYDGEPIYWARGIEAVSARPTPGAPAGFVDIEVRGYAEWHGQPNGLALDMIVDLVDRNGRVIASEFVPGFGRSNDPTACGGVGCGGLCGFWNGLQVDCSQSHIFAACVCGGGWLAAFPGIDGDGIDGVLAVVLRPAPGALPELPGFGDDDERYVGCDGDLNYDGVIDQADLGILLASFGVDAGGDIDGDGDTDQADLGILLAVYRGHCAPV